MLILFDHLKVISLLVKAYSLHRNIRFYCETLRNIYFWLESRRVPSLKYRIFLFGMVRYGILLLFVSRVRVFPEFRRYTKNLRNSAFFWSRVPTEIRNHHIRNSVIWIRPEPLLASRIRYSRVLANLWNMFIFCIKKLLSSAWNHGKFSSILGLYRYFFKHFFF